MSKQNNNKPIELAGENAQDSTPAKINTSERKPRRLLRRVAIVICCLLVVFGATFLVLFQVGKIRVQNKTGMITPLPDSTDVTTENNDGRTVTYKGETYRLNENMVTILGIGIDKKGVLGDFGVIGENGQADVLVLGALDTKTGKSVLINISRDTMIDVDVYSKNNNFIRVDNKQICLAFAYGDGKKTSCDNVIRSVSRLFYNMPIKNYVAMNMEPIGTLNDAVGGVTVTALDTVPLSSRTVMKNETITLRGNDAKRYVQYRNTAMLDSNTLRNMRQQQYLDAFAKSALKMTKDDISTPVKLLNKVSEHVVTNLDASKITYLTTGVVRKNAAGEIDFRMVPGHIVQGEKYAEFIVDEIALYELILDVFYNKDS